MHSVSIGSNQSQAAGRGPRVHCSPEFRPSWSEPPSIRIVSTRMIVTPDVMYIVTNSNYLVYNLYYSYVVLVGNNVCEPSRVPRHPIWLYINPEITTTPVSCYIHHIRDRPPASHVPHWPRHMVLIQSSRVEW